jgi:outer membrane lipase/esterase
MLAATALAQNRTFTSQYSFGDSLSDNGNFFALTNRTQPPPTYFEGRLSNGLVFAELLGSPIVPAAALSSTGPNRNFAFFGATAAAGSTVPDFSRQIASYRLQGLPARDTDLFTVVFGATDLSPVLSAPATPANPGVLDVAGAMTAQAVAAGVQSLVALGAKNLVVAGLPNLGATPRALAVGGAGGPGSALGLRATNAFNRDLRGRLEGIASGAPDVNVVYVDLQGILDHVIADPQAFGFTHPTSFYLAPAAQGGGAGVPDSYVFFDDIHPTARTHALVAAVITEQLNPELPLGFAGTIGTASLALQGLGATALDARMSQLARSERPAGRADAYASFNYSEGARARDHWRPKFEYESQVVTTGADLRVSDAFFVGGALNAGRLDAEVRTGRGEFRVEDAAGRLYAVWRGGPVSLLADADYGVLTVKGVQRPTAFGGTVANSKVGGDHWGAGLKAVWAADVGLANVRPFLGVRTHRVRLDAFTERDVPALAMHFDPQDAESTSAAAGVDAAMSWRFGARLARLDLRGVWHGEIGSPTRAVAGRLADNVTRTTSLVIEDGDGSGVELGGALTVFFRKNWSASAGYAADIRTDEKVGHRGTFSVQTGF